MSNNTTKESFERELKAIEASEALLYPYKIKKLIAYVVRTAIMVAIYYFFWEFVWLRWTLLLYIPLNLFGLGMILGAEHFLKKKMKETQSKINELDEQ
ncbi:MAG: hypothetical protein ACPG49_08725 [Chitinophagales bacterium]